eukprot:366163-Chlamydomonas_euryale.AAC.14
MVFATAWTCPLSPADGFCDCLDVPAEPRSLPCRAQLASASSDRTIRVWDLKIMEEVAVLEGHRETVYR